jgi:hypothetical protein
MRLAEDQHAVEELAPYSADETFADGVHPWSLHGGAQDPGAICLEDSVEGLGEVRSAVADHELDALEAFAEAEGQIAAWCTVRSAVGFAVTPPRCIRRVPCSMNTRTSSRFSSTVST